MTLNEWHKNMLESGQMVTLPTIWNAGFEEAKHQALGIVDDMMTGGSPYRVSLAEICEVLAKGIAGLEP